MPSDTLPRKPRLTKEEEKTHSFLISQYHTSNFDQAMSTLPRLSIDCDKTRRKSCHRSNNSGELESLGFRNGASLMHELGMLAIRDDCNTSNRQQGWREGRVSLDIPSMKYTTINHHLHHRQYSVTNRQETASNGAKIDVKKHRQPSSPGGKLASFFNSLINQALSKKKKLPKSSNKENNIVIEQESPNYWRKLRSTSTKKRTSSPPNYPINITPTKSYKSLFTKSRCKNIVIPSTKADSATVLSSGSADLDWLDEKLKCIKQQSSSTTTKEKSLISRNSSVESLIKRFKEEEEDGGESDSSSDLFELQLNYDDHCSTGLPVYETTCVDTINRSII
ncbi:uncharacterized protein [Phyllobates terribilis]|uniref:uncharacterized protein n=1 Tax=Phyllobates terribilis TaxID=111132 RepID=UPI003CCB3D35